ncbi:XRE family transcriptional regulator [Candidatus Micrarchaeota archaeon RBG_16_36_9]|nr:MAG: XRE family transcriptional regulator [Candidatus Micrarchaeota archaeon RBG_16_36_9]
MDTQTLAKDSLAKRIAGEIVLSDESGKIIQKWRNIFKIPQRRLADEMKIMPSVISDYENGRRKSPGVKIVKRMVQAMISLDEKTGGKVIQEFSVLPTQAVLSDAILDMKEFETPIETKDFAKIIEAPIVVREDLTKKRIYGYTVVDSLKAITDLSSTDMVKLYGLTSERALIFVKSHTGRSSMIALKVTNLRPGLVVLQGSEKIDDLAKRIAELEGIPIAITKIKNIEDLIKTLKKNF